MEKVDILLPPTFEKSGTVKTRKQAIVDGDWIGTFNLWIIQSEPTPSIVYQQRSSRSTWAPNKLDVTAGGHYQAGETIFDGLREVKEELGRIYSKKGLTYLGRKLHVSPDIHGLTRHNVVDIFFVTDNSNLDTYDLEEDEVYAIVACPIKSLIQMHANNQSFKATGIDNRGKKIQLAISRDSFPYNWDNYHFKIALLADRYLRGEQNLLY